jgi:hypothetical protein
MCEDISTPTNFPQFPEARAIKVNQDVMLSVCHFESKLSKVNYLTHKIK